MNPNIALGNSKIDLVIFDCDGVIVDSEIISAEMLIGELHKLGVDIDHNFVSKNFLGRAYPSVFAHIRDDLGVVLPPDFAETYRNALLSEFEKRLRVISGVEHVALNLCVPFCVATSSSRSRAMRSLEIVGAEKTFGDNLFTSSQVEHGKPAPDLPLFAAKKMGAVPQRCLLIEDSFNGIRAGLRANMQVARFTGASHITDQNLNEPEDAQSHWQFNKFEKFFDIRPDLAALST